MIAERQTGSCYNFLSCSTPFLIPAMIQAEKIGGVPILPDIIDTLWEI
ncbi:MAG: hypothetical protein QXS79_06590 [Candidatus Bathyarchaeia archaeon]